MPTPHNQAEKNEIAKRVIMPGDPLRAEFIAETYLKNIKKVNEVRGMYAFTGSYHGKEVTVMGSGMGMPSMGIYSYELYKFYDVERIIRTGTTGAYIEELNLYDIVLADKAWSESSFARTQNGYEQDVLFPDAGMNQEIMNTAGSKGLTMYERCIHSSDVFYTEDNVDGYEEIHKKHGCVCVDMESFALFHNARVLGKKAACLLTVSDNLVTREVASQQERQTAFTKMMELALEAI